jgi:hypothetical protein
MKTNTLPLVAFLAAIAAYAFLPVSAVAAFVALSVTGVLSVAVADYGRRMQPLRSESRAIPLVAPGHPSAGLRKAA